MKRTVPTLALLGTLTLGSVAWLQITHAHAADGPAEPGFTFAVNASGSAAEPQTTPQTRDDARQIDVPDSAYSDAIRALLAAAPGQARDDAAERFRSLGPDAFAALCEALAPTVERYRACKRLGAAEQADQLEPLVRLLDTVAQQRDAYAAGLFWYTDLEAAKAQAQQTGKPILSLRMLGNLDDEYSCANSRFFRTALYADETLGNTLRNDFILHWQSVRPVPVITIDMGDGRIIRRTITGNSCHLVLDPQGRPVDVIPGLYGPRAFEAQIDKAAELANELVGMDDDLRGLMVRVHHSRSLDELDRRWQAVAPGRVVLSPEPAILISLSDAIAAGELAPGKYAVEQPLVNAILSNNNFSAVSELTPTFTAPTASPLVDDTDSSSELLATAIMGGFIAEDSPQNLIADLTLAGSNGQASELLRAARFRLVSDVSPQDASAEVWQTIAAHYAEDATLDAGSRRLMSEKTIPAEVAARMAFGKSIVEDPLLAMVQNFQGAISLDTARNEHLLHRQIHEWFVNGEAPADPDALTSRVYAELFLTPDEDPWLGLVPPDTYSALDAAGLEECDMP
ncbi:MAG: hypothetical protein ACIAXF_02425 [Phycisphaerales bacterium JB063]